MSHIIDIDYRKFETENICKIFYSPKMEYIVTWNQIDHSIVGWLNNKLDKLEPEVYYKANLKAKKNYKIISISDSKHVSIFWEREGINYNAFIDLNGIKYFYGNENNEKIIEPVIKGDFSLGGCYLITGDYLSYKQDPEDNYVFSLYEVHPENYKRKSTFKIYRLASVFFSRIRLDDLLFDKLFLTYKDTRILSQWNLSLENKLENQYPLDVDLRFSEIKYLINESLLVIYGPVKDEDTYKICVYSGETRVMISQYKMENVITYINFLNVRKKLWLLISIKDFIDNHDEYVLMNPYSLTENIDIGHLFAEIDKPIFFYEEMVRKKRKCESELVILSITGSLEIDKELVERREKEENEVMKIITFNGKNLLIKDFDYDKVEHLLTDPSKYPMSSVINNALIALISKHNDLYRSPSPSEQMLYGKNYVWKLSYRTVEILQFDNKPIYKFINFPYVVFICEILDDDLVMVCNRGIIIWTYESADNGIKMKYYSENPLWLRNNLFNYESMISCNDSYELFLKPPNFKHIFKSKESIQTTNGKYFPFVDLYKSYINDKKILRIYSKEILESFDVEANEIDEKYKAVSVLDKYLETYNESPFINVGFLYLLIKKLQDPKTNKSFLSLYLKKIISTVPIFLDQRQDPSIPIYSDLLPYWSELLIRPPSTLFIDEIIKRKSFDFYKRIDIQALIDYKWYVFGIHYYLLMWMIYSVFFGCFTVAASVSQDAIDFNTQKMLLQISIVFGFIQLYFEIREFIWAPLIYIFHIWNIFGAYILPIITSMLWLKDGQSSTGLVISSNLLLEIKFILYFRPIKLFGVITKKELRRMVKNVKDGEWYDQDEPFLNNQLLEEIGMLGSEDIKEGTLAELRELARKFNENGSLHKIIRDSIEKLKKMLECVEELQEGNRRFD
ncbi:3349_t:CDS:2 [Funneliformis mosseae]|uniref:3349_t:CDS:1 n=1 Tax=Funneliformis mosseae TaxID=27381 RepID=A0A9N9DA49_FUNMO|nr:3349_t:CDS:2 [Funneliformis mosseae]